MLYTSHNAIIEILYAIKNCVPYSNLYINLYVVLKVIMEGQKRERFIFLLCCIIFKSESLLRE